MVEQASGPLSGLRILEFESRDTVPLTGMVLADMGADVVRVRRGGPDAGAMIPSLYRGRMELTLDLSTHAGRAAAVALVERADALVEGFAPGIMEKLGLGPEQCLERNPALAYCRLSGWGREGPFAGMQGTDINYLAISGALHAIGPAGAPIPPLALLADFAGGGLMMAMGLIAAVFRARDSGQGQVVDVSKLGGAAALMSMYYSLHASGHWPDRRAANMTDGGAPFYRCYSCSDARYIAVGALEPGQFAALCDRLGIAKDRFSQYDRAGWGDMTTVFAAIFASRTRDAWEVHFEGADACVTPVLALAEAPHHPHNEAARVFGFPSGSVQPMPVPNFSVTPASVRESTPATIDTLLSRWDRN
ncbi:MAG: CaiB/BaiF CoA-transferase family protein [Pseudomonadota bacterium]